MAEETKQPEEDLSDEQKLGLAAIALLAPALGGAMGGKQGAMTGAALGLTGAGKAWGDIGEQQQRDKDKKTALAQKKQDRADHVDDEIKIETAKAALKPGKAPETKTVGDDLYEKGPDGAWKKVVAGDKPAAAPTTRSFDGKLEQWNPKTQKWDVIATETPKPEKPSKLQQTTFERNGHPLTFNPNTGQYEEATAPEGTAKPGAEPKDTQVSAATYGRRLEQSEQVFSALAKDGYDRTSLMSAAEARQPLEAFRSGQAKQQAQAERNFINALLRRESGAAISNQEFDSAEQQYFPRAGDTKEVVAQKEANRAQALAGLKAAAGPAWDKVPLVDMVAPVTSVKPKVIRQGGHTYQLNEKTGEYE